MNKFQIFSLSVILSLCLAIFTCFVSNNLNSRFQHRHETIEWQFATVEGRPMIFDGKLEGVPAFQNRVLFPSILSILINIKTLSVSQWFLFLRLFTSWVSFLVFFYLLIYAAKAGYKLAAAGAGLLAYELIFTFNQGWEHPTDFLDVTFISLFLWVALERRRLLLFLFALLAATNRESCVFAGLIWFFLYGISEEFKLKPKETLYATFCSFSSYVFSLMIRYAFRGENAEYGQSITAWTGLAKDIKEFITRPSPTSWPVLFLAMFLPVLLWIYGNRRFLSLQNIRLLIISLVIFCISLAFGSISELRVFIPSVIIIVFVAVSAQARAGSKENGARIIF